MGKVYPHIDEDLVTWISAQHLFFVASAPSIASNSPGDDGFVNCSPKGMSTFAIVDPSTVAYLDLTGSGVETIAHLRENGRIVIMFCALEGAPKIVRLHGRGIPVMPGSIEFEQLRPLFIDFPGVRSIIKIDVTRVSDSCGYGVPQYKYVGDRETWLRWAGTKGEDDLIAYQQMYNAVSIDGLPALSNGAAGQPGGAKHALKRIFEEPIV